MEVEDMLGLPLPRLAPAREERIAALAVEAAESRGRADVAERELAADAEKVVAACRKKG